MHVLLDEHLPVRLAPGLTGHEVSTVRSEGWAGAKNGALLALAGEAGFEVLLTNDRSMEFQQNVAGARLGVVMLNAPSNRLDDLLPLVPAVLQAISEARPGEVHRLTDF